ncbi:hypothetical protein V1L54_27975 [Streptomyces sp. TRM 70361]|uniref:hypothetical protein n=1 Tax=Streptomyces sp. TRM 70361 TaxID=3116553 RepID=UPI002E7B02E4|nr:hypothetical protein [Streptomyces sp. TRM 70361]MEE1943195.1 hypothetical protein [Streptomyces sp. TRM 70361]
MPGYEALLTRVMSELVMLKKLRPSAGSRLRARGGPPVIEITGLGEAERNHLLERLHQRYWRLLPVNNPAEMPLGSGPVTDSFWYLSTRVYGLGGRVARRRPIRFPRFALGMMAHAWVKENGRPDLEQIEWLHEWLQRELRKQSKKNPPPAGQVLAELEPPMAAVGGLTGGGPDPAGQEAAEPGRAALVGSGAENTAGDVRPARDRGHRTVPRLQR